MFQAPSFHWQATLAYLALGWIQILPLTITQSVSRSCFYHIRALRQIRGALCNSTAATVASALVSARLDYVNSILYGTSAKQITRLQHVQNALGAPGSSSLHLLNQLHWLPVEWRIKFKNATLTFKALETGQPPSSYVHMLPPDFYALPHPNFFKFNVPNLRFKFAQLFLCVCSYFLELIASQRSFL